MSKAETPDSITARLREGFERIALVLRSDLWMASGKAGLNPTQAQALALLAERTKGPCCARARPRRRTRHARDFDG